MSTAADQDKEEKLKLIEIVREAIRSDNALREKHQIGEKFRFVRDRLNTLLQTLEESMPVANENKKGGSYVLKEGEVPVYVYLYNSQGLTFRTWQNMLGQKVFYEYSVNRPIYSEKSQMESLLRTKTNKAQHAYLTVAVKSEYVYKLPDDSAPKDAAGNPVIKVKEGSLQLDRLIAFTHQEQDYVLNENGELIKR